MICEHKKPNYGLIVVLSTINCEIYVEFEVNVRRVKTMRTGIVVLY